MELAPHPVPLSRSRLDGVVIMVTLYDRLQLMTSELAHSTCDLGDGREVERHLREAGFTRQEMHLGLDDALEQARAGRINDAILAGRAGGEWADVA